MSANTTLHFDIVSGIAGDMSLSLLCGLGLDIAKVTEAINKMTGREIEASIQKVFVNGIESNRLSLNLPHEHVHRTMKDIGEMISSSDLPDVVKADAIGIFQIIAEAEGSIHGQPADKVHFHEVGALDSIFDIVGFAYGKHLLNIDKITSSSPVLGCGLVKCAHGKVPVPAPATLKVLEGVDVKRTDEPNEMTTPTGAAILKYYVKDFGSAYNGKVISSSYSTGTKAFETVPNILRGTIYESEVKTEKITLVETNIDDCSGEVLGSLFESLKDISIDTFITPITGKKNRPSNIVSSICKREDVSKVADILFSETTTAGIRYQDMDRIVMEREFIDVKVKGYDIRVKKLSYGHKVKFSPEWDDCVSVSKELGISALETYDLAKASLIK